jgi:hypothetical protein
MKPPLGAIIVSDTAVQFFLQKTKASVYTVQRPNEEAVY